MNQARTLTVAAAQIESRLGDLDANVDKHLRVIDDARAAGTDVLLFPEMSLTGHGAGADVLRLALERDDARLARLAEAAGDMTAIVGLMEEGPAAQFYNTAIALRAGEQVFLHRKINLATYGRLEDGKHFATGRYVDTFELGGPWRSSVMICADLWNPGLVNLVALHGCTVLFSPISSAIEAVGGEFDNPAGWHLNVRFYGMTYGLPLVMANRVGREDGLEVGHHRPFQVETLGDGLDDEPAVREGREVRVVLGDPAGVVGGERDDHLVVDVRPFGVVVGLLGRQPFGQRRVVDGVDHPRVPLQFQPRLAGIVHREDGHAVVPREVALGDVLPVAAIIRETDGVVVQNLQESARPAAMLDVGPAGLGHGTEIDAAAAFKERRGFGVEPRGRLCVLARVDVAGSVSCLLRLHGGGEHQVGEGVHGMSPVTGLHTEDRPRPARCGMRAAARPPL